MVSIVDPWLFFYTGYFIAIIMLLVTSYMDLKTREIEPRIWIPFGIIAIALLVARVYAGDESIGPLYILLSLIAPAILLALGMVGMMGLADPIAMLIVALLIPSPPPGLLIPPSMFILVLSSLSMLFSLVIPISIYNTRYLQMIRRICGSLYLTIVIATTGIAMPIERFERTRFLYPLVYPEKSGDSIRWICRASFNIDEDPEEHRARIRALVETGLINRKERIFVTWGVPYILFILIGAILYPILAPYAENIIRSLYIVSEKI